MPGTTYTARPASLHDPAGRLADFARFVVDELETLTRELEGGDELPPFALETARTLELTAHRLADRLAGFTTAADITEELELERLEGLAGAYQQLEEV